MILSAMKLNYFELADPDIALHIHSGGSVEPLKCATEPARVEKSMGAMRALEAGAIANEDEARQVGHYWLRAPNRAPDASTSQAISQVVGELKALVNGLAGSHAHVLHVGIGGSALGPQFLVDAFSRPGSSRDYRFVDSADPAGLIRALTHLNLHDTLVVVVTKSGGTREVLLALAAIEQAYRNEDLSFAQHAVAITSPESRLAERASNENWLSVLPIWSWVGGRTSIFSAVGLLPLALVGGNVDAFLEGAASMDEHTRSDSSNMAMLQARAWLALNQVQGLRNMVVLPYRDRLLLLGRYLQQLVMESLGKKYDRQGEIVHVGLTVYGNKGTTDQHALVQQLVEGPADNFVTLVDVLRDDSVDLSNPLYLAMEDATSAYLAGTRDALLSAGRPVLTLTLASLDERHVGALIALMERTVGFFAELVNINPYNQPGVEAGKVSANQLLSAQEALMVAMDSGANRTADDWAKEIGVPQSAVAHLLKHLAATERVNASGRGVSRLYKCL
jgi:glucose-6-phosphate isomerase